MIEMLKRHEVQVLRRAGHTWKEIAALSGVSVRTVRRIAAETAITTIDNAAERARREVGRPSKAEALSGCARAGADRGADVADGGIAPSRAPGGLHRREERGLCLGADAADAGRDAAGPIRRAPGRILAARFRRSARALSGRDRGGRALLRLATEVLALGRGDAGARRAGRDPGARARRSRRRLRRHSAWWRSSIGRKRWR